MIGLRSVLVLLFVVAVSARLTPRQQIDIENDDQSGARFTSLFANKFGLQSTTQKPCVPATITTIEPTTPSLVTFTPVITTSFISPTGAPIPSVIAGPQTPSQVTPPAGTGAAVASRDENEDGGDEFEDEDDFEDEYEDFQELQAADDSAELRKTKAQNAYYRQRLAQIQRSNQMQRVRAARRASNMRRRNQMKRRRAAKQRANSIRRKAIKKRNSKIRANNNRRRRRLANSNVIRRIN